MINNILKKRWGSASAFLERTQKFAWIDLLVITALGGILFGVVSVARTWTGVYRPVFEIDLAPIALVKYTFYSLSRGLLAYVFSLTFTLVYGFWAAKDKLAARILLPLLDILQSIPVLGFMPGLVLALVALFPKSNIGLELAAVIMIFTGQAWNMTFSFYQSLRSVPQDFQEVAVIYRFNWWERFRWTEAPFATVGLVWNSMMSMAGGWFFLMINEAFVLGDKDFRLPGIGSYMSVAVARGDIAAMIWAVFAMIVMIVTLDQLLWRPVVVWAQRFRVEESAQEESMSSWFLTFLNRSRFIKEVTTLLSKITFKAPFQKLSPVSLSLPKIKISPIAMRIFSVTLFIGLVGILSLGAFKLLFIIQRVSWPEWLQILTSAFWTLCRVLSATVIGTLWAVPAGLMIGLSPRLSRGLQPVVQVAASFPAPMLFPAVIALLKIFGIPLGIGSVVLMLLGTQWYILFNVIAGAMAIPADLREAARSYRLKRWQKFIKVYLPSVFPYLVTGWVTAAGGAWNASIVSEYVTFKGHVLTTWGLGSHISRAAETGNFPALAAGVIVMSSIVVLFNRVVWRSCYQLAERRFSLNK